MSYAPVRATASYACESFSAAMDVDAGHEFQGAGEDAFVFNDAPLENFIVQDVDDSNSYASRGKKRVGCYIFLRLIFANMNLI